MTEKGKEPVSQKRVEARNSLADELKPIYDEIVKDYSHCAFVRHGHHWVSYGVLADLVREGWRRVGKTSKSS